MTSDRHPIEKLRNVEEAYGRAMLRAHGFERALATLLICRLPQDVADPEAQVLVDKIKSLTLGALIEKFCRAYQPPRQVAADLQNILKIRNDLTHRIAEAIERASVQTDWDRALVPELDDASRLFEQHMRAMRKYLAEAHTTVGLDETSIKAELRRRFPGAAIDA